MEEQKPSIGRTVLYNHSGSADGKYPAKQSPAIIQGVNEDGSINCVVFASGPGAGMFFAVNVNQGVLGEPRTSWNWPPRV